MHPGHELCLGVGEARQERGERRQVDPVVIEDRLEVAWIPGLAVVEKAEWRLRARNVVPLPLLPEQPLLQRAETIVGKLVAMATTTVVQEIDVPQRFGEQR